MWSEGSHIIDPEFFKVRQKKLVAVGSDGWGIYAAVVRVPSPPRASGTANAASVRAASSESSPFRWLAGAGVMEWTRALALDEATRA